MLIDVEISEPFSWERLLSVLLIVKGRQWSERDGNGKTERSLQIAIIRFRFLLRGVLFIAGFPSLLLTSMLTAYLTPYAALVHLR